MNNHWDSSDYEYDRKRNEDKRHFEAIIENNNLELPWGNGSAGKILQPNEHYSAEYKIQILNSQYKQQIIDVMTTFDWKEYLNCIAMRKIQQFHIIDVLRANIEGFE